MCSRACVCVSVCVSLASDSSETVEVIIVKRGTESASGKGMGMQHVLITFTLDFIQGHTGLYHETNTCLISSETVQAMPIKSAVKIVR